MELLVRGPESGAQTLGGDEQRPLLGDGVRAATEIDWDGIRNRWQAVTVQSSDRQTQMQEVASSHGRSGGRSQAAIIVVVSPCLCEPLRAGCCGGEGVLGEGVLGVS